MRKISNIKTLVTLCAFSISSLMISACSTSPEQSIPQRESLTIGHWPHPPTNTSELPTLKVASINLAHGRATAFNQLLVSSDEIRQNLLQIANYLKQQNVDIVALQEADAASAWSGSFNHVEFLAQQAGYAWYSHGLHSTGKLANYGTAILSKYPITEAISYDFAPSPPTTTKGFTAATVQLTDQQSIDVVSLHLDFSRSSVRYKQMAELSAAFERHDNTTIIMGDFNSEWDLERGVVSHFETASRYHTYQLESEQLASYKNKRLDWIFLSKDVEFINYTLGPQQLSDHRPILSLIKLPVE